MTDLRNFSMAQLVEKCGISESTIRRQIKATRFPDKGGLSDRRVGWRSDEIEAWLNGQRDWS